MFKINVLKFIKHILFFGSTSTVAFQQFFLKKTFFKKKNVFFTTYLAEHFEPCFYVRAMGNQEVRSHGGPSDGRPDFKASFWNFRHSQQSA